MSSIAAGFTLLLLLGVLAAVASIAVAERLRMDGAPERAATASLLFLTLLGAPVHALGWLGALDATNVAIASAALSLASLGGALAGGGLRERVAAVARASLETLRLPFDALRAALAERSFAAAGLAAMYVLFLYSLYAAWLAPSSSWDGIWYHESMVGFALQNRGFAVEPVPQAHYWVNGYPRAAENLMLFVTCFADRRLIDVVPSLVSPLMVLSFYVLARRVTRFRVVALGFASALFLLPGFLYQLRSTYIDGVSMAGHLAAILFVTRPTLRARDLVLAALAVAFLAGTKATGLFHIAPFGGVLLLRVLLDAKRSGSARMIVAFLAATAILAAFVAPTYLRNVLLHDNPIWPLRFEALGVVWEGPADLQNMQFSAERLVERLYHAPVEGKAYVDTRYEGYGFVLPYLLPMVLYAFGLAIVQWLVSLRRRDREVAKSLGHFLLVVVLGLLTLATSPAYYWARYSLPAVAAMFLLLVWLARIERTRSLGHALAAIFIASHAVTFWWSIPSWDVTFGKLRELAALSAEERALVQLTENQLSPEAARAREAELGPGDVVAFTDDYAFIGNLWNERMSNEVRWVPFSSTFPVDLERAGAEWVGLGVRSPAERALLASRRWERVGSAGRNLVVYRRTSTP